MTTDIKISRELVQRWIDNTDFFENLSGKTMAEIAKAKEEDDKITEELRALLDAPAVERQPVACVHEWTDDGEFLLACTACGAQENHNPEWRDMASAPRDGTLLRLLVEFDEHSTEDDDQAPTIGANNFDNDEQDEWLFAGWCWTHDHWVQGKGSPVGWLPMIDTSPTAPAAVVLPDDPRQLLESLFRLPEDIHWIGDRYMPIGEQPYSFESLDRSCEWDSRLEGVTACLDKVKELNK